MIPGCLHGNVEGHQAAYDRCVDCGERIPTIPLLVDRRVGTEFYHEWRLPNPQWRLA